MTCALGRARPWTGPRDPGQAQAELFSEIGLFLNKPLVPGSFAAWGRTFLRNRTFFLNKPLVPGSFAAWGRTFSQKSDVFEQATCPGQLRCLGQNFFSEKSDLFLNEPLVPGSFAAWGRTLSQKSDFF